MTELIELNKFSHIHNDSNIIFCKTDFVRTELSRISKLKNDVVLISGNSDYGIDSSYFVNFPENISSWYAQNALYNHPKLHPLPLGLENFEFSIRENHGIGYERAKLKEELILNKKQIEPTKKIYSNFKVDTNPNYRKIIKNICIESEYIEWEEPNLNLNDFFSKLQDYEACVCPIGNGVDTHRLWEVLYFERIPITIKVGDYKIYELYEKLPIVILDQPEQLFDENLLHSKIQEKKHMDYNKNILKISYWTKLIQSDIQK